MWSGAADLRPILTQSEKVVVTHNYTKNLLCVCLWVIKKIKLIMHAQNVLLWYLIVNVDFIATYLPDIWGCVCDAFEHLEYILDSRLYR